MPGRGRSCLFRPKANLPACLYESYILHYFLLERDGCTDWCMGSVGPLHLPVLPAACLTVQKPFLLLLIVALPHCIPTNLSGYVRLQDTFATSSPSSAGFTLYLYCLATSAKTPRCHQRPSHVPTPPHLYHKENTNTSTFPSQSGPAYRPCLAVFQSQ